MPVKNKGGADELRKVRESVQHVRGEVADLLHELAFDNKTALATLEEQVARLGARRPRELLVCRDDALAAFRSADISLHSTLDNLMVLGSRFD